MTGSIARRYAKAIFSLAKDERSLEETGAEIEHLAELARDSEIGPMLSNPLLSATTRQAIARSLAEQMSLRPTTRNFLCLLADHQRLDQLVGIASHYRRRLDEALGRVRAMVTSAAALTSAQKRSLTATLERVTGKKALLQDQLDSELLGGIVVEVEGKVYDGSLRTQLEHLAAAIAGGKSYL